MISDEEHVVQALETQSRSVESSVVTQQSDADSKNSPREGHLNMPESMNCQSTVVLNTVQVRQSSLFTTILLISVCKCPSFFCNYLKVQDILTVGFIQKVLFNVVSRTSK